MGKTLIAKIYTPDEGEADKDDFRKSDMPRRIWRGGGALKKPFELMGNPIEAVAQTAFAAESHLMGARESTTRNSEEGRRYSKIIMHY